MRNLLMNSNCVKWHTRMYDMCFPHSLTIPKIIIKLLVNYNLWYSEKIYVLNQI